MMLAILNEHYMMLDVQRALFDVGHSKRALNDVGHSKRGLYDVGHSK